MNLRNYAKGKPCMIRLPGCTFNPEETVLCHWRDSSTGMGQKEQNFVAAWGCAHCHAVVDGRERLFKGGFDPENEYTKAEIERMFLDGIIRTQQEILRAGIIKY